MSRLFIALALLLFACSSILTAAQEFQEAHEEPTERQRSQDEKAEKDVFAASNNYFVDVIAGSLAVLSVFSYALDKLDELLKEKLPELMQTLYERSKAAFASKILFCLTRSTTRARAQYVQHTANMI